MTKPQPKPEPTGGAPVGNTNALQHGLRSVESIRRGLQIGQVGPGGYVVSKAVNAFRRQLEKAVLARHKVSELTFFQAATIQSASRCELVLTLIQRQLRECGKAIESDTLATLLTLELRTLAERAKHLDRLSLSKILHAGTDDRSAFAGVLFSDDDGEPDADSTPSLDTVTRAAHGDAGGEPGTVDDESPTDGADAGDAT